MARAQTPCRISDAAQDTDVAAQKVDSKDMARRTSTDSTVELPVQKIADRLARWMALAVALVAFAVFIPSITHPFVVWDDAANFVENTSYRGLGPQQIGCSPPFTRAPTSR